MGFIRRSTIVVLVLAAAVLVHVPASTAPLAASAGFAGPLSCLQPVDGLTWLRWSGNRQPLDLWCHSVGRPILEPSISAAGEIAGSAVSENAGSAVGEIAGMRILSWNVHVGAGRLEVLLPRLLKDAARDGLGLTILLQETFRTGDAVPEAYPATLQVPRAIRPRRPAMDVHGIAAQFGLSVAYVPSMRNGPATAPNEREDRGNAILSTELLVDVSAIELPFGKQRRVAITALVVPRGITGGPVLSTVGPPRPIRVVSTHLDTNGDRAAQAVALSDRLTAFTDAPLFVGGDLNSRYGLHDNAFLAIASRLPMAPCGTGRTHRWPLRLDVLVPIGRIDFMFTGAASGDLVRSCETLPDAYNSDHLPLLMTLRY
jgi:endonuclease/exonuclease/phosphatase family metal-dependent hydrolase